MNKNISPEEKITLEEYRELSKLRFELDEKKLECERISKALAEYEAREAVLVEALENIKLMSRPTPPEVEGLLSSKSVNPASAYRIGKYNAALIAETALSTTSNTAKQLLELKEAAVSFILDIDDTNGYPIYIDSSDIAPFCEAVEPFIKILGKDK